MKIEVLHFDGCPNHTPALDRVREVLGEEGVSAEVSVRNIPDDTTARATGFLGSPSIRIDGVDVEPAARAVKEFGMMCRTYVEEGKRVGLPPRELIRTAIREARESPGGPRHNWMLSAAVVAAMVASLCCILPIVAAATGLGTLAAGAVFDKWRPYLLGVTGLLLGAGIVFAYRNYKKACAPGSLCAAKPMSRWNFIALGTVAVLVAGLSAFPYYSGAIAEAVVDIRSEQYCRVGCVGSGHVPNPRYGLPSVRRGALG